MSPCIYISLASHCLTLLGLSSVLILRGLVVYIMLLCGRNLVVWDTGGHCYWVLHDVSCEGKLHISALFCIHLTEIGQ